MTASQYPSLTSISNVQYLLDMQTRTLFPPYLDFLQAMVLNCRWLSFPRKGTLSHHLQPFYEKIIGIPPFSDTKLTGTKMFVLSLFVHQTWENHRQEQYESTVARVNNTKMLDWITTFYTAYSDSTWISSCAALRTLIVAAFLVGFLSCFLSSSTAFFRSFLLYDSGSMRNSYLYMCQAECSACTLRFLDSEITL